MPVLLAVLAPWSELNLTPVFVPTDASLVPFMLAERVADAFLVPALELAETAPALFEDEALPALFEDVTAPALPET